MNFYDNLWKITILLLLLYIIYIIYEVQIEIKEKLLPEKINKNIVYKTFNDNDNENLREEILDFDYENENEHDLQSISDISIQSINSEDLKTKNVKELKSFAKSLNINTSKKKKDDIITDILFYCNK